MLSTQKSHLITPFFVLLLQMKIGQLTTGNN